MALISVQDTLTKEDDWRVFNIPYHDKYFEYSVWGTWEGTVTLQVRSARTDIVEWIDVVAITENTTAPEVEFNAPHGQRWRIGFKTGDYVSGSAVVDIRG